MGLTGFRSVWNKDHYMPYEKYIFAGLSRLYAGFKKPWAHQKKKNISLLDPD